MRKFLITLIASISIPATAFADTYVKPLSSAPKALGTLLVALRFRAITNILPSFTSFVLTNNALFVGDL